ncbi:efflux RND transporter periplasmic adaptor subunit [Acetobacter oeni]|uniref:Hemolysin secretion protein D n=1 Tax=Acetobacter oeni TaxID=304077 RepID=A0A511XFR3_9PROT|nr:efflux RND transporter periplasmic adaptor subunit [Acetobacter oeni]MBB3882284.1 cobalt-zinc-cadmium efflux system membrane fusion protein [Acetobacter oeni]NHO18037.1 efflux RND transporter periplasmic adaptor subunit [Acetobacter oeni]GBR01110.1 cation efflux protein [Acetobacter oeni LMG 21952]GEN61796.1 hemolysin secretion protein D [Acetobacter oeni]
MKYFQALALTLALTPIVPSQGRADTPAWSRTVHLDAAAQASEKLVIVPVRSGELHGDVSAMASVVINAARSVVIRPAGSGKVTDVKIIPGEHVSQGQVMIVYTDHSLHELYLQRSQALAALASARASLSEATTAWQRGHALNGSTVSTGEVQRRLATKQQAQAMLAARQADIDTIDHRLTEEFTSVTETIGHGEESRLISPVSGMVQSLAAAVASDITAGEAVAVVTDLSTVWIVAEVRPREAAELSLGGRIFTRPAGDEMAPPLVTTISTIDGMADPATGLLRVVSIADNRSGNIRPGEMLDARLETKRSVSGLIVPTTGIQQIDGHSVVYTPDGRDGFQPHEVRVLLATDDLAVIGSNLTASDKVVSDGSFALKGAALLAGADGG